MSESRKDLTSDEELVRSHRYENANEFPDQMLFGIVETWSERQQAAGNNKGYGERAGTLVTRATFELHMRGALVGAQQAELSVVE